MRLRRTFGLLPVLILVTLLVLADPITPEGTAHGSSPIFAEPEGREIGWIVDREYVEILESREGWTRVRLEGWILETPRASIQGLIQGGRRAAVLLLPADGSWRAAFQEAEASYREEMDPLADELARLRSERDRALKLENFTEAAARYDALDSEYRSRREQFRKAQERALFRLMTALAPRVVARTLLEEDGAFRLHPPGPGDYRMFIAAPDDAGSPGRWVELSMPEEDLWMELDLKRGKPRIKKISER